MVRQWFSNTRFFLVVGFVIFLVGCAGIGSRSEHTLVIGNVGQTSIVDFSVTYGGLGERRRPHLGLLGIDIITRVEVPEFVHLEWTTEEDGARHIIDVPLIESLNGKRVSGKAIVIEINQSAVKVYLGSAYVNFKRRKKLIFEH